MGLNNYSEQTPFAQGHRAGALLKADLDTKSLKAATIIPTGIWPLDVKLEGGMRTGEVTLIAAQSGRGKSALGEQIALSASEKHRTTFFALEMGRRRTETRMLGKIMRHDIHTVTNMMENHPDHALLRSAFDSLTYERQLIVEERDDSEAFTMNHVMAMIMANDPKLVVIDHPRHLDDWHGGKGRTAYECATDITRRIIAAARFLDIHIIIVCQTKVQLQSSRPRKEDIADTYALGQNADTAIMVHRPYRGLGSKDTIAELIVDKNRNGGEGIVHTRWHGPTMTYKDLMPAEEAALECCGKKHGSEVEQP